VRTHIVYHVDNGELKINATMSRYKYPIEYELNPTSIDKGTSWLTLKLKNTSTDTLRGVDIQLHSLDTYYLMVYGAGYGFGFGQYLKELRPNEEVELFFRINAFGSADVYATIKAREEKNFFWWESGWTHIYVSEEKAELERLLVLSHPYTQIGKTVSAEATVKGLRKGTGLKLEFWVEPPSGKSEKQATTEIKELSAGEESRYSAEFTPKETGGYTIYAYLYDGWQRIGHKTNYIYVQRQ
jgi:hypothetical protein